MERLDIIDRLDGREEMNVWRGGEGRVKIMEEEREREGGKRTD